MSGLDIGCCVATGMMALTYLFGITFGKNIDRAYEKMLTEQATKQDPKKGDTK